MLSQLIVIIVNFVPILIAIILHEIAHGYTAYKLGDDTAKKYGRLSFNPIRHVDPFGTIILPALLYYSGVGFIFGWAKPVPVNFSKLKSNRDMLLVASAGIIVNIFLALVSAILLYLTDHLANPFLQNIIGVFLINMVVYNIVLAVFNLLPIPPLDGSKIFFGWINLPWAQKYVNSEHAGLIAIIGMAFVLPIIGNQLHMNLNLFGWYMIHVSKFFISMLI